MGNFIRFKDAEDCEHIIPLDGIFNIIFASGKSDLLLARVDTDQQHIWVSAETAEKIAAELSIKEL